VLNVVALQAETQKLNSQKQYFEHAIAKLEKDLRDAIDSADTTDRDAKYALLYLFVRTTYCTDTLRVTV